MILDWIDEARKAGARQRVACNELGLDPRTIQRWRSQNGGEDRRRGPKTPPANKLSPSEREEVLRIANSPKFRNLSPHQIVPMPADEGRYLASESTFYRILRQEKQLTHRGRAKPAQPRPRPEHHATGPNQVWSWDITYLRGPVAGQFYYLYLFVDVWSRKIVADAVQEKESSALASQLLKLALATEDLDNVELVVHSDNGAPMKGATFSATLERLGLTPSYSRPQVSDDNPYSEALFRTLKYRPGFPRQPFASLEEARQWVGEFRRWYNHEHLHSAIGFVSPASRHEGQATTILKARTRVYAAARERYPQRWNARPPRDWNAPEEVFLNPSKMTRSSLEAATE